MDSFFGGLGNLVFFSIIKNYLNHEANYFLGQMLGNVYGLLGGVLLTLLTIWVMINGYLIMTGQSRESLMGFVVNSAKTIVIVTVATGMGTGGSYIFQNISDGLSGTISSVISNSGSTDDAFDSIDKNLALMQSGLGAMKAIDSGDNEAVDSDRTQAIWMSGVGTAGPAVVAGTMLLINKFGMALFVGLGPIFIICLLFKPTAPMFHSWLKFGMGLMISLAVLTFMSDIAMRMVGALALVSFTQNLFGLGNTGFTNAAMQQGGLGLILTGLLLTVPNMATNFIGTAASGFSFNSAFGSAPPSPAPAAGGGGSSVANMGAAPSGPTAINKDTEHANPTHAGRSTQGGPASHVAGTERFDAPRSAGSSSMGLASGGSSYGGGVASGIGDDSASVKAAHTGGRFSSGGGSGQGTPAGEATAGGASEQDKASPAVAATNGNAGGVQPMQRSYAQIQTEGSSMALASAAKAAQGNGGSSGGSTNVASAGTSGYNPPATGGSAGGTTNSSTTVNGVRTASVSNTSGQTVVPQGRQNPARS